MDKEYGRHWNCVVGRDFGSYVTHRTKTYIYFSLDSVPNVYVLLWQVRSWLISLFFFFVSNKIYNILMAIMYHVNVKYSIIVRYPIMLYILYCSAVWVAIHVMSLGTNLSPPTFNCYHERSTCTNHRNKLTLFFSFNMLILW